MSTGITTAQINNNFKVTVPAMWEDADKINEIRKLFAPKLTESEFQYFVGLGKATGLNPFLKEIWSVKYDERTPAQVFIGRDGYRKAAQAHSEYDYHQSDAVYENDVFEVQDGLVKHSYKLTNRGALIGAYCIAKRHKSSRPIYVFVELKEYSTGKSVWNGKPATMIKKVAESQCLRACFQDLLGGTYGEEEMSNVPMENNNERVIQGETQVEKLKSILNTNGIDKESITIDSDGVIIPPEIDKGDPNMAASIVQIHQIEALMSEKSFDDARKKKALDYFKVSKLEDLTDAEARMFLLQLGKA
jgi:phage recombination protein Bet